jgi:transcription elongation GreA/GreB family factor
MNNTLIKETLYKFCIQQIQNKLDMVNAVMNTTQNSANSETKSTAGDKHDTARAMAHLETEKNAKQLSEINKLKKILPYLKSAINKNLNSVELGSVVETDLMNYYISSNLGKTIINQKEYLTISPISPIAKLLKGKKTGDKFNFNNQSLIIRRVF